MHLSLKTALARYSGSIAWIAIFAGLLAIYTRHIDYPIYWHPDEPTKAHQLLSGTYNFYHPQLLLRLTSVYERLFGFEHSFRGLTLAGRFASATCAALASVIFGIVVSRTSNWFFGAVAAVMVGLSPLIFESAHYAKEDASLLLGIGLVFLALQAAEKNPSPLRFALLGAAAGIALSAKYIGALMLLPAVALLIVQKAGLRGWMATFAALVASCALINYPALIDPAALLGGFSSEWVNVAVHPHSQTPQPFTSPRILVALRDTVPLVVLALWLAGIAALIARRPASVTAWSLALMPLLFLVVVQFSLIKSIRYGVPTAALSIAAAVWVCGEIASKFRSPLAYAGTAALMLVALASNGWMFKDTFERQSGDIRLRLVDWIRRSLPADAVIAGEGRNGLPDEASVRIDPSITLPQRIVREGNFLGDSTTIETLRASGVTHVVVTMPVTAAKQPTPRQQFYSTLMAQAKLLQAFENFGPIPFVGPRRLHLFEIKNE